MFFDRAVREIAGREDVRHNRTEALARTPGARRTRRRSRFLYGLIPEDHPAARVARSQQRQMALKTRCRLCGGPLLETLEVKLGRCGRCPSNMDENLLEKAGLPCGPGLRGCDR